MVALVAAGYQDQLRPVAGDSDAAEAIKVLARAHQQLIWERTRHLLRLRSALREFFPAALIAFGEDLAGADALELLAVAPDPVSAARLSTSRISAALKRARRRQIADKTEVIRAALRTEQLGQPDVVSAAYAATVRAQTAILTTLQAQITTLQGQVEAHFGQHPDAEIILSQPGLGSILGARVLGEFGDDPHRYDALDSQAQSALNVSPGARAYYDQQRHRGLGHRAALRQLANRLVGILHGCLKTTTRYDEAIAWPTTTHEDQQGAA